MGKNKYVMKHNAIIYCLFFIVRSSYACSLSYRPNIDIDTSKSIATKGEIVNVNYFPCDTSYDTVFIERPDYSNTDTTNWTKKQKHQRNVKLFSYDRAIMSFQKNGTLSPDSSYGIKREIRCPPTELVILPNNSLLIGNNIDTIVVTKTAIDPSCRSKPILDWGNNELIGKQIELVTYHSNLYDGRRSTHVHLSSFNMDSYIKISDQISDWKSTNWKLELFVNLLALKRTNRINEKIKILVKMGYLKNFLIKPNYYEKLIELHLGDCCHKKKRQMTAKQADLVKNWKR